MFHDLALISRLLNDYLAKAVQCHSAGLNSLSSSCNTHTRNMSAAPVNILIVLGISLFYLTECSALRIFHLGRGRGGMLGAPHMERHGSLPPSLWYDQLLDHFNPSDQRTWKQRYFVNSSFWQKGGPVFLMIGGEGPVSPLWVQTGAWIDYAKRHKALCFQLEHRYYGESKPTPDTTVKSLQWLNSEQALADLARFIVSMNEEYSLSVGTRWVAFGGSYPGSLAAWLRMKYSHLVYAAVSSSGPLLAKVDFKQYFDVVYNALETQNPDCVSALEAGSSQIKEMLQTPKGKLSLNKLFKLCEPLKSSKGIDIEGFFETLAGNVAGIVQYSGDNREFEGAKAANITIPVACSVLQDVSLGAPVHRVAALNSRLLNAYNMSCLDYTYNSTVEQLRNISWSGKIAEGGRQWMWQTCTEFGFYQTSTGKPDLFGDYFPVEYFIQQCMDVFGPRYNAEFLQNAVDRTNTMYGGLGLQTSRVVFVHGSVDPWHALGITQTLDPSCPAIYIKGTAHCANMYPATDGDPPQLRHARRIIDDLLARWLGK